MRYFALALGLLTFIGSAPAGAQPTLLAIEDGEFSFFEPVTNESGDAYAVLGFSLVYQNGSDTAPNPILAVDDPIGDDTLRLIRTSNTGTVFTSPRPLAPVFGSDAVLLNARIERADTTQVNSLLVLDPTGDVVDQIDGDNAALFGEGQTPTDTDFGMQSARSYLGDAIPGNEIETVIGFANAAINQAGGPTTPQLALFGPGGMGVLFTPLGFFPGLGESHGDLQSRISIGDLEGTIGDPIPDSAPAFRYNYSNVNGQGSFGSPVGTVAGDLAYGVSIFLVRGGSGETTRIIVDGVVLGQRDADPFMDDLPIEFDDDPEEDDPPELGHFDQAFETNTFSRGLLVAGSFVFDAGPKVPLQVGGIKAGPVSVSASTPPKDCDCDARIDPKDPKSDRKVDLNGDGKVDKKDRNISAACALGDPNGPNCRDVNDDGKIDYKDTECVTYCKTLEEGGSESGRGLEPGLVDPMFAIGLLIQGRPIPDRPDLTLDFFGLTRAHPNGFGLFGVFATPPNEPANGRNLLISQALSGPPKTVFEEGVDYGDGVVETIPGNGVSNINRAGRFSVVAILASGETAIYSIQIEGGFPPPPNRSRESWRLYI